MRVLRRLALLPVVVLALVVACAALSIDELVQDLVFRYVVSHEVRLLANGFTVLGTVSAGTGLLGALAVAGYWTADLALWRVSLGGLAGVAIGGLATQAVKHVACRARPRVYDGWGVGPRVLPHDAAHGFVHWPCVSKVNYQGFPSGHATTAFAVAAALTALAPALWPAWLATAAGIGASRILLNAHFLSDVLGGGLLGWWAGKLGLWVVARFTPHVPTRPPPAAAAEAPPSVAQP